MTDLVNHPPDPQEPVDKPLNVSALIALYVEIRDHKRLLEKQWEDEIKLYNERLDKISGALHKYMQDHKLNSLPTDGGTAYISTKNTASVADGAAFRGYIIETRSWDLADWRANANAVYEFMKEHGTVVPGVNFSAIESVGVRRPAKGK